MMETGFSDSYLHLRDKYRNGISTAPPAQNVSDRFSGPGEPEKTLNEKIIKMLWYESRFDRRHWGTIGGDRISIHSPGEWNTGEGPDFQGAQLTLGDEPVQGDIEIDVHARDWKAHRHDRNPRYNKVVLHVYLFPSSSAFLTRAADGRQIPSASLLGRLPQPWNALEHSFDVENYPYDSRCGKGSCGKAVSIRNYETVETLLNLAGDGRILLKTGRMDDPSDYTRFCEGLGYAKNKKAMARLAELLPLPTLMSLARPFKGEERKEMIETLLFGVAGLLLEPRPTDDMETHACLARRQALWDRVRGALTPMGREDWNFKGVRPTNYPHRRLAGLALLLDGWAEDYLSKGTLWQNDSSVILEPSGFVVPPAGYFARRATWNSTRFPHDVALIGPDRSQALWVNVYLPALLREIRRRRDAKAEERLHGMYRKLRLREPAGVSRLMAHRLLGSEKTRRVALNEERQQQGLLQLFQDFCDTKPWVCDHCAFPKIVGLSLPEIIRGG